MINLGLIDKRVLSELDLNSRSSCSSIAKKIKLSRSAVEYRIKKLIAEDVITSCSAFIDPAKFGLTSWKVYLKFYEHDKIIQKQMEDFLLKNKKVWWIVKCESSFDLLFACLTRTVHEFYNVLNEFQMRFSKYELRIEVTTHINPDFFSRGYLLSKDSKKLCPTFLKEPVNEKLDNIDIKILRILAKDSRLNSVEIATKLNLTPRVVIYRIQDLVKRRIITNFRLLLDVNKFGMDLYKVMIKLKEVDEEKRRKLNRFFEVHPNIVNCCETWGPWEMEFEAEVSSYKELVKIINDLRDSFSNMIMNTEFILMSSELKKTNDFLTYMDY